MNDSITRREMLKKMGVGAAVVVAAPMFSSQADEPLPPAPIPAAGGPFSLPALPYALDALEPHIDAATKPTGELAAAVDQAFSGFAAFQEKFNSAATKVFGSGWAWLSLTPKGALIVETTPNQDNPLTAANRPLLGLDVWEHAYYLKYQNRRPDYIKAFANVVNWDFVSERYALGRKNS